MSISDTDRGAILLQALRERRSIGKVRPELPPRALIEQIRTQIWELYQDLKAYRQEPDAAQKPLLEARFDTFCGQKTGYPSIDGVLK